MRILIADDHTLLRQGLKQILADEFQNVEFGEAGTSQQTIDLLATQRWDVLLLDINMPGRNGLEVLRETRDRYPALAVLVLSSAPEEQLAVRVLKAGAAGYLNKQAAPEELVEAIKKVHSGGRYVGTRLGEKLAAELSRPHPRPQEQLSDREFQVMQQLAGGKSLKEIADDLSLSIKTISTFRGRILEKLKLQNNVELAHFAREHGLMEH
ncbi:MAG: Response regulator, LuxR family [Verrucomicrobiales bacterium]|nr:Response regulator, LuxR family [Verrucomicrobiales bacterium]